MFFNDVIVSESTLNIIMMSIWLSIFLIALIIEISTAELVSIWFSGGALFALIFTYIPNVPFFVEIIVFFVTSGILLILLRPLSKRLMEKHKQQIATNIDAIIGKRGIIIKEINPLEPGEVKVDALIWNCINIDDTKIEKGQTVEVIKVEGNKLTVKKI